MNIFISLTAFIFAVGLLVTIHEFGHYIVGRLCGMKVLRFSIGFGKPIYSVKAGKDRTEYCVSRIPLGGYVQFLDNRTEKVNKKDYGRAFDQKSIGSRIAVLLAGPFFNFLFAILAYFIIFSNGIVAMKPLIGVIDKNSYAASAGLAYGDQIIKINDKTVIDWEHAVTELLTIIASDNEINFQVKTKDKVLIEKKVVIDGKRNSLTEPGALFNGLGFYPWQPPAIIGEVQIGSPAEKADLLKGDQIIAIDNQNIRSFVEMRDIVARKPNQSISVEYMRNDSKRYTTLVLGQTDGSPPKGVLGVAISNNFEDVWYLNKYKPIDAVLKSINQTWASTSFTVVMFTKMLSGDVSVKNISGPVSIAKYAGLSAVAGTSQFLKFLALVSISLGVINLLPIPMLDGGQIVFQTIEWLKGSPLSVRSQLIGQQFGIMILLALMSLAFYNDLFSG